MKNNRGNSTLEERYQAFLSATRENKPTKSSLEECWQELCGLLEGFDSNAKKRFFSIMDAEVEYNVLVKDSSAVAGSMPADRAYYLVKHIAENDKDWWIRYKAKLITFGAFLAGAPLVNQLLELIFKAFQITSLTEPENGKFEPFIVTFIAFLIYVLLNSDIDSTKGKKSLIVPLSP